MHHPFVPAKAGTQIKNREHATLDSRFRGNERRRAGNDALLSSASHRALTAYTFQLRFSLLITGRKQWSGSDHTRRLVLHTTQQRVAALPCPGRSAARAKRSGALQTPISGLPEIGAHIRASRASPTCADRYGPWRSRISGAPLHFVTRCTASGTRVTPVASLSHDVKQPYSTQRRAAPRLKSSCRRAAWWGAKTTRPAQ